MGWFFSDDVQTTKTVEATGAVNNNINIEEPVPVHNDVIVYLLYVIAAIKVMEMIFIFYKSFIRVQKKKYTRRAISLSNINNV